MPSESSSAAPFESLPVFRAAMAAARAVYELSSRFPSEERYGLVAQMRRASASTVANIAEGWSRRSRGTTVQLLDVAYGSVREVESLLLLSVELGLCRHEDMSRARVELAACSRQLLALLRSMRDERVRG